MERIHLVGRSADGRRLIFARVGEERPLFEVPITGELRRLVDAGPAESGPPPEPDHQEGHVRLFAAPPTLGPIRQRGRPEGGLPPGAFHRATGLPDGEATPPARGVRAVVGEGGTALVPTPSGPARPAADPVDPVSQPEGATVHTIRSRLSAGEIQIRLRAGRTAPEVAAESGAPEDWVRRLEETITRERRAAVGQMLSERMAHPDRGRSPAALGDALAGNLRRRGIRWDSAEVAWAAARPRRGPWRIRLTYVEGGRERWAEWRFDPRRREATPADRLAGELGWEEPPGRQDQAGSAALEERPAPPAVSGS